MRFHVGTSWSSSLLICHWTPSLSSRTHYGHYGMQYCSIILILYSNAWLRCVIILRFIMLSSVTTVTLFLYEHQKTSCTQTHVSADRPVLYVKTKRSLFIFIYWRINKKNILCLRILYYNIIIHTYFIISDRMHWLFVSSSLLTVGTYNAHRTRLAATEPILMISHKWT